MIKRTMNYNSRAKKTIGLPKFRAAKSRPMPIEPPTKKRRRNGSPILLYVLLGTVGAAVLTVLSLTVLFRAGDIIIDGTSPYTNAAIIQAADVQIGDNIFRVGVNSETVSSTLPHIRNIQISRRLFPSRIVLRVETAESTYKIAHQTEYANQYIILDDRFHVLRIVDAYYIEDENFEGITITGVHLENPTPGKIAQFANEYNYTTLTYLTRNLQENNFIDVNTINIADAANINMIYNDRILLTLGTLSELVYKLQFANEIIAYELPQIVTGRLDLTRLSSGGNAIHFSPGELADFVRDGTEISYMQTVYYEEAEYENYEYQNEE